MNKNITSANLWKKLNFTYPSKIPTMISPEEQQYLYWLGGHIWSGEGIVIEIGPWLGGSTVCLAMGMQKSGHDTIKRLKVFDNFIWRKFMADRFNLSIKPGDSFEQFFQKNISEFDEIVETHVRALPDDIITDDQEASSKRFTEIDKVLIFESMYNELIEILFVDGAKSWLGMLHLLKILNKNLIPNKSYIVCQDYKYWQTYWVPLMIAKLEGYLQLVHIVKHGTTVTFRITSKIPSDILDSLEDNIDNMDINIVLLELDNASCMLSKYGDKAGGANVRLAKVSFLAHRDEVNLARDEFVKIQKSWNLLHQMGQLELARKYLNGIKNLNLAKLKIHNFMDVTDKNLRYIKRKLREIISR